MPSPRKTALDSLRQQLDALQAPEMPRPLPPLSDPTYQIWRKAFQAYTDRRDDLRMSLRELGGADAAA